MTQQPDGHIDFVITLPGGLTLLPMRLALSEVGRLLTIVQVQVRTAEHVRKVMTEQTEEDVDA